MKTFLYKGKQSPERWSALSSIDRTMQHIVHASLLRAKNKAKGTQLITLVIARVATSRLSVASLGAEWGRRTNILLDAGANSPARGSSAGSIFKCWFHLSLSTTWVLCNGHGLMLVCLGRGAGRLVSRRGGAVNTTSAFYLIFVSQLTSKLFDQKCHVQRLFVLLS